METQVKQPWGFCETPQEKCTMNYYDENGCQNRVRNLVEPIINEVSDFVNSKIEDQFLNGQGTPPTVKGISIKILDK